MISFTLKTIIMKKIFLIGSILIASFAFSQVKATAESKDLNQVYKGGTKQLLHDVQDNYRTFSSDYAINGQFLITFDLDKEGNIVNPKISPEQVENSFKYDFIRTFKRVKNNFKSDTPKKDLAVLINFKLNERTDGLGQSSFTREPRTR